MPTQDLPAIIDESNFEATLMRYRGGIDAIDKQIVTLLKERMSIVQNVGKLKEAHGVSGSYIRPGREAIMVRDLLEQATDSAFPAEAIIAIWRIIIGASTGVESPLNSVTLEHDHAGAQAASHYFGAHIPHKALDIDALLATLAADRHAIAVLPYDKTASWWGMLPPNVRVFACVPFIGESPSYLALGYVTPEATGNDVTLCYADGVLKAKEGFMPDALGYVGAYAKEIVSGKKNR